MQSMGMSKRKLKEKRKQPSPESRVWKPVGLAVLGLGLVAGAYWGIRKPQAPPESSTIVRTEAPTTPRANVPPFHESEEAAEPLPRTLSPAYFRNPYVAQAYRAAQRIPGVLAQQPCYCQCDKIGHRSLLDCYVSTHAAG